MRLKLGAQVDFLESPDDGSVVHVEYGGTGAHNELIACIAENLSRVYDNGLSNHDVIVTPSTVITFLLKRCATPPGSSKATLDPFVYPKTLFLDRFLYENVDLVNKKRTLETKILDEDKELKAYRNTLTRLEVSVLNRWRISWYSYAFLIGWLRCTKKLKLDNLLLRGSR